MFGTRDWQKNHARKQSKRTSFKQIRILHQRSIEKSLQSMAPKHQNFAIRRRIRQLKESRTHQKFRNGAKRVHENAIKKSLSAILKKFSLSHCVKKPLLKTFSHQQRTKIHTLQKMEIFTRINRPWSCQKSQQIWQSLNGTLEKISKKNFQ